MAVTFAVDDVQPAPAPRATRALRELAPDALVIGGDAEARVIDHEGVHPLLAAVHVAFSEHRPLVLSPDVIWLTIAQGVAQHVRLHAEELRPRFVRHSGKQALEVFRDGPPPTDAGGIEEMIDAFRGELGARVGEGLGRLFVCDFSTTTRVERVASEVVLLDAFSPYFELKLMCICGIPEVTLLGTPEDYRVIRERVEVVSELGLGFWRPSLARVADELVESAEGRPDRDFWRAIYKPRHAYGWDRITGWIARLYPYVLQMQRVAERNPLLETPFDISPPGEAGDDAPFYQGPGVTTEDVPGVLSRALVDVLDRTVEPAKRFNLCVEAGLTHVEQDSAGRLIPRAGYWAREREVSIHEVIERICREHVAAPARQACPELNVPADVVALNDSVEALTLFEEPRAWRLRAIEVDENPLSARGTIQVGSEHFAARLLPIFDLPGDRLLCTAEGGYVIVSAADVKRDPGGELVVDEVTGLERRTRERIYLDISESEIPVLEWGLAELLARVLDGGPDIELPVKGTLADVRCR